MSPACCAARLRPWRPRAHEPAPARRERPPRCRPSAVIALTAGAAEPRRQPRDGCTVDRSPRGDGFAMSRPAGATHPAAQEEVARVFERYARTHAPVDQEALVVRFLPLARYCARRYDAPGEREDLEQVASLALVKAIERYDPARGIAFTSFAMPTIMGEIKRHFRDRGWMVKVP